MFLVAIGDLGSLAICGPLASYDSLSFSGARSVNGSLARHGSLLSYGPHNKTYPVLNVHHYFLVCYPENGLMAEAAMVYGAAFEWSDDCGAIQ